MKIQQRQSSRNNRADTFNPLKTDPGSAPSEHSRSSASPHRRISRPGLDPGKVRTVQVGRLLQPFLGPFLCIPQLAYPLPQGFDDRRL
jgi:hypothetical protein